MKTIKYAAPWLAAAAVGAAVALAPIASAATHASPAPAATTHAAVTDTDPATPYGTDPDSPAIFGYHTWLGDDQDVPF
jgi:hypothetical protein